MNHVDEILKKVEVGVGVRVRVKKNFSIPRANIQLLPQVIMDKLKINIGTDVLPLNPNYLNYLL